MYRSGICTKNFPKDFQQQTTFDANAYPTYRRRNNGRIHTKAGFTFDNRRVVPYNPRILQRYRTHRNCEVVSSLKPIKCIFKYIHKGNAWTTLHVANQTPPPQARNEVQEYLDARTISPAEACWNLFEYNRTAHSPPGFIASYSYTRLHFLFSVILATLHVLSHIIPSFVLCYSRTLPRNTCIRCLPIYPSVFHPELTGDFRS
jgi:hypothetical protein